MGCVLFQEQIKVMNEFEENPFIADEDDIIEAAPFNMQRDVDDEFDDCLDVTD